MSLLCKSIGWGNLEDIKKYWTRNDIVQAQQYGLDPIVLASVRGDEAILKFLLNSNVGIPSQSRENALIMAAAQGNQGIVRLLLESGVDREMYRRGPHPLHCERPLHTAAMYGHVEAVRMLIEFGFSVDQQAFPPSAMQSEEEGFSRSPGCRFPGSATLFLYSLTPLECACLLGHVEVVRVLLNSSREPWIHSAQALHLAAVKRKYSALATSQENSDHEKVVRMLLEKGYNVDTLKDCETPLCWAVKFGSISIAQILLGAGANVNFQIEDGKTPLHFVMESNQNQEEMLKLLIANGANVLATDSDGSTLLHLGAEVSCPEAVKVLLESGIDPNCRNSYSETPLFYGVDSSEIVDMLLSYGAQVNGFSENGESPLLVACHSASSYKGSSSLGSSFLDICRKLLKAGADPNAVFPMSNESPLGHAVSMRWHSALTDLLVSYGANVHNPNLGETLLHTACWGGSSENIVALLEYGAHFVSDDEEEECFHEMADALNRLDIIEWREHDPFEFYFIKMNAAQIGSAKFYAKHPLNPCNMDPAVRNEFRAECEKEVDKLKKSLVAGSNISHLTLLKRPLPVYRGDFAEALSSLVDDSVNESFSGLPSKYPNYWRLLKANIQRGLNRGKLYEEGHRVFKRIPDLPEFPIEVMDLILSYLTDEELANLRDVLSPGRISRRKRKLGKSHSS